MEKQMLPTNLILSDMTGVHSPKGLILSLSKEDYKDPEIPRGYELKFLPPTCASHILQKWSFSYTETQEAVQERLSILKGIGAFRIDSHSLSNNDDRDNNFDSLVSWSHQYLSGAIGMTYTLPEERGKGLAGAVTLSLAKLILDEGRIAFCYIESTNDLSLKLHQKLGFKVIGSSGISLYTT
ncbi:hypothetical protein Avbf_02876 [Armadillidium vulgare]|nr:hypothetical protein Avbf_02876 [Armadillidium vulgare]